MFGFQLSVSLLLRIRVAHLYKVSTLAIVGKADCVNTSVYFNIKYY